MSGKQMFFMVIVIVFAGLVTGCASIPVEAEAEIEDRIRNQIGNPFVGSGGWSRIDSISVKSLGAGKLSAVQQQRGTKVICYEATLSGLSDQGQPQTQILYGTVSKNGDFWDASGGRLEKPEACQ